MYMTIFQKNINIFRIPLALKLVIPTGVNSVSSPPPTVGTDVEEDAPAEQDSPAEPDAPADNVVCLTPPW